MARLTRVLNNKVGLPTVLELSIRKLDCTNKDHAECAECAIQTAAALREAMDRLEAAIARGIEALDIVAGDPDMEPSLGWTDREMDADHEPTLGWSEPEAPKDLWLTDGGHGRDGDDD